MPQTLLLADDSVTIQRVIELTFADEDIQVIAVSDGDQAIARLEASPPDIVLADVGMPGKNGYEVAQYIRQSPRLAHIPVVLLTGAFEPVDQARADEAGCDGVLAKPFEPQLVISRVKELLNQRRPVASPASPAEPAAAVDRWSPSAVEPPFVPPPPQPGEVNDYFDRLDAAFATLSSTPAPRQEETPIAPRPPVPDAIDWFGTNSAAGAPVADQWDLPAPEPVDAGDLTLASVRPPTMFEPSPPALALHERPAAPPAVEPVQREAAPPPAPPKPVALPPLADAFAALLAAEQGPTALRAAPTWPASGPSSSTVTDDVVEQVARRVLERLSDRVVSAAVQDAVVPVAERLVREEIERIKSSIK